MTIKARIYQPAKTAMQSGQAKTRFWLLEYTPVRKFADPLMGWTGSSNTLQQLRLRFPSQEAAISYAKKHGIPYELEAPRSRGFKKKSYADNFRFGKIETYTPPATGKSA